MLSAFSISGFAQNGLTKIMSIENALMIARQSIQRASGIRLKKETVLNKTYKKILKSKYIKSCLTQKDIKRFESVENNILPPEDAAALQIKLNKCFLEKRIRLTDTIGYLGITDEFRLGALRRYIVRNSEIGVKSIWSQNGNNVYNFFILSNNKIENISAKTTVTELALLIQKNSGLPYLPYETSANVIKNCRITQTGKTDEFSTLGTTVSDDVNGKTVEFIECLQGIKDKMLGVSSVKITDNSGDTFEYFLTAKDILKLKEGIISQDWKYQKLISELSDNAIVPSSAEFVATKFVINTLLDFRKQNVNEQLVLNKSKTFRLATAFPEIETPYEQRVSRSSRCSPGNPQKTEFSKTTVKDLCISPNVLIRKFIENSEEIKNTENHDYIFLSPDKKPLFLRALTGSDFALEEIKDTTTIDELINLIINKIEN